MEVEEVAGPSGDTGATATPPLAPPNEAVSVMAASSVQPSVTIQLHPLVIMNVAEHWTRIRAQNNGRAEQVRCCCYR